jgi:hypothetical protein
MTSIQEPFDDYLLGLIPVRGSTITLGSKFMQPNTDRPFVISHELGRLILGLTGAGASEKDPVAQWDRILDVIYDNLPPWR